MDEHQVPKIVFIGMLNLNLITILYIAGIIMASLLGYAQEDSGNGYPAVWKPAVVSLYSNGKQFLGLFQNWDGDYSQPFDYLYS